MLQPSIERQKYHELVSALRNMIRRGSLVYDVGKSHLYDYHELMHGNTLRTIDIDPQKSPDYVLNVEGLDELNSQDYLDPADAVLCNGVVEQCDNPYDLIKGVASIVKEDGFCLFGIISVAYPVYSNDRVRFTPQGAEIVLKRNGFEIIKREIVHRGDNPSYCYFICRKGGI